MAKFSYRVRISTRKGLKELHVSAESAQQAKAIGARTGTVLRVTPVKRSLFQTPLSAADRQIFLTRLSAMMASRLGLAESLRLIRDTFGGPIAKTANTLYQTVEHGTPLPEALQQIGPPDFPDSLTALIRAGSRAGDTAVALNDAVLFEQEIREVRKSASKGIFGAISGFLIAVGTILSSSFYFGPEVLKSGLIASAGKSVQVGWVFTLGYWIGYASIGLLVLAAPLLFLGTVGKQIAPGFSDKLILKIPFYRDIVLSRGSYVTLYGLAMLVRSGVRLSDALKLAQDTAPKGALRQDLEKAHAQAMAGKPWATAMDTLHPTDKAALASALDKEQVTRTLMALANQYRQLYAQRVSTFVPAMTLISALLLTIAGGILYGEIILPMLQASSGVMG